LAIIQAVSSIGRSLGREVVAEGVETATQHAVLKAAGVHTLQGYLFGKPMVASEFVRLLTPNPSSTTPSLIHTNTPTTPTTPTTATLPQALAS
jgi:EAL domain-containing protein (putative c-di-GMP-specific phosphodiesterase class I)